VVAGEPSIDGLGSRVSEANCPRIVLGQNREGRIQLRNDQSELVRLSQKFAHREDRVKVSDIFAQASRMTYIPSTPKRSM